MTKCGDTTVVEQADTPARFTGQWPKNVVKWSTNWTTRQRTEKSNNQLDNYVPLCTIMYHYVPLCTIMYHCAPLCTIMYHYVTLWTTMYHYVPLCTIMYHYVPLCATMYHYVPWCTIITMMYHYVPLCTMVYHYVPLCTTMYHYVPLCTTMYHYVPLCTIMYHYVAPRSISHCVPKLLLTQRLPPSVPVQNCCDLDTDLSHVTTCRCFRHTNCFVSVQLCIDRHKFRTA